MNKWIFTPLFLSFFALSPVFLAVSQTVPTKSTFQFVTLLTSAGAFGLMLSLFWLSRLMPRNAVNMRFASTLRLHKWLGYSTGLFFLFHPVLIIARRFWVQESLPLDNLKILLSSPLVRPGIAAWILLVLIMAIALLRKKIPAKTFRYAHGLLSIGFTLFATRHIIATGRHSHPAMIAWWIALAGAAIAALLYSYVKPLINKRSCP